MGKPLMFADDLQLLYSCPAAQENKVEAEMDDFFENIWSLKSNHIEIKF